MKMIYAAAIAAAALAFAFYAARPGGADPSTQAFNTKTGTLDVDYASYLSKHDVVFNRPIGNPLYGLTVGNGRVGAMVWNANGLTMQISGVDASQQGAFSQGLINLNTTPAIDAGTSGFQQRLSLYDGVVTTKYGPGRTVTIMGSPNSEVMGIHVEDNCPDVSSVVFDLSLWDVSKLTGGDVPDIQTWQTVTTYADQSGIGLSRGQADANNFGYTLAASVEGGGFTTQSVDPQNVRLVIKPSRSYTIWIACASRLNAPKHDSIAQARKLLSSVRTAGYAKTFASYKNWWHGFWQKSFVQYSGISGDGDYLENMYYLSTYMIASGAYANYPFHFINGAYSAVGDAHSTKWSHAYWYWNQRDVYNSFLASNHVDAMDGFNRLYSRNFDALKSYTKTKYGIDGIWVPETMGWDGNARHTDESSYTKDILSSGTEAAENMYLQYAYSHDETYLKNTAYPFMREIAKFYAAKLSVDNATGKYYVAMSNAHETYWGVRNAITDLAAVRSLFPITIDVSKKLGMDASLRVQWQKILDNLIAYPVAVDVSRYLPHDPPKVEDRNDENVTSELIWPYSVTGIGAPDYQLALNGWNRRPHPYDNVWANDAVQAARLGLGDEAYQGMKLMLQKYQNYPNGRTSNTNGEFEYLGVHLSAMNEALLQSYNDKIRVFPAVPSAADFTGKFTLLAKGGFLVSSEYADKDVKYIGIKSLYGGTVTVVNPWPGQQIEARGASDEKIDFKTTETEISFPTVANGVYVVERPDRKLGSFKRTRITAAANNDVKKLPGTASSLGVSGKVPPEKPYGGKAWPIPGVVQAEDFDTGEEGAAYHDNDPTNTLGEYRTGDGVDIQKTDDTGGGFNVGFTDGGEWMNYTVNVAKAGIYTVSFRVAAPGDGGSFHLQTPDGAKLTDVIKVPSTGGWQTWNTVTAKVTLPAGEQIVQLYEDDGGFNINSMSFN